VTWFKAVTLFAFCLIAFSFFYYYVIFLPRVETTRLERETRERTKQQEEDKARQAATEKTVTDSPSILEEQEKARRELERAQAAHERQVREHEAKEREKWEAPNDNTYVTVADISVYKWPMLSSEIVARIPKAMKVYVVGVRDNWLQIESKRGNPSGYIEKKYALVEKEAKKLLCLAQADANYRANWDKTCAAQGRPAGCTLLASVVANLDQNHRAARDECFRLYPQR